MCKVCKRIVIGLLKNNFRASDPGLSFPLPAGNGRIAHVIRRSPAGIYMHSPALRFAGCAAGGGKALFLFFAH
ncbi:hypothetical protein [uncultured Alistipes sp.]|uniref:hypothetical protein n=1 Tax=uncultured Alistipes sp. TaxID=538949 RepID=UPI0026071658|nr:hypothetical protein [uncultured Alistipes sp.]